MSMTKTYLFERYQTQSHVTRYSVYTVHRKENTLYMDLPEDDAMIIANEMAGSGAKVIYKEV